MNYEKSIKNIRQELKNYIKENNIKSLVLGVSGGIDSAICAVLAKPVCDELNIPLIGRSLPVSSNTHSENLRAEGIGKYFCTDFQEMVMNYLYEPIAKDFNPIYLKNEDEKAWKIRNGNIKARLRMIYLYNLASEHGGLVLSTDNWTEYLLGFWTLHGDVGDYGMIQELWKTEVYEMSEWLVKNELFFHSETAAALQSCINCQATDGLGITNSDLDQIIPGWEGSSKDGYKVVDEKLDMYIHFKEGDLDNPVINRYIKSNFKRNNPINIKRSNINK